VGTKQAKEDVFKRTAQTNVHQQSITDRTATVKGTAGKTRILREIGAPYKEGPVYLLMVYLY